MITDPKDIEARIVPAKKVAAVLGMCANTFKKRRPELLKLGFPAYDDLLKGYDIKAVNRWLDMRSNIQSDQESKARDAYERLRKRRASLSKRM